jgi:membrane protein YdbS with pleckstrin-like domain
VNEVSDSPAGEVSPGVQPAGWRTLDPRSVLVARLAGAITTTIVAFIAGIGAIVAAFQGSTGDAMRVGALCLAAVVATGLLAWFVPARRFRFTRYKLDALGLLIHRGRLFHSEIAVLRSRIQHTDVSQGPIERAFDLGTLSIYTAGTAHGQVALSGLALDDARRLRADLAGLQVEDAV